MRVFVAGATGAIGRPLVPKLLEAGHEVTGTTRHEERAAGLREAGARAAVVDALDPDAMKAAVVEAQAEVIVHELTALPDAMDFRSEEAFAATNRLRSEGTRILLEAAQAVGTPRMVVQSIAFIYAPTGDWVKAEDAEVLDDAGSGFGGAVRTVLEMERSVTGADHLDGLVLRYGFFYGPGTSYAPDGSTAAEVRKRRFPVVGRGDGVFSFVHVEDAADATVAAVERGAPGIYNVVDDEPAPLREWLPVYADALGAKKPLRAPKWLARLVAGRPAVDFTTTLRGASNEKARHELGWEPRYPSWRQGFREALA